MIFELESMDKATILIVDDTPMVATQIGRLLKDDYKVKVATGGEKALAIAASEPQPDLILLDIMMPGIDGYETCRRLKSNPKTADIPVVFLSARSAIEDEIMGLELGGVDYITKPISPPILKIRVRNHVDLKRKSDMLQNLSIRDGLTGIYNRRYFDQFIEKEWQRAKRKGVDPISLIIADIDHFKLYNDHYGHGEGDNCIIQVTKTLTDCLRRSTDLVARYGGEEFVCLMPGCTLKDVELVALKIQNTLSSLALPHDPSDASEFVTISMGGACMQPDFHNQFEPKDLINAADRNLYRAKELGRNRLIAE